ncbi:1-acyl-sn-glycerol-3-phosphate acyltransferase [Neolewinella lacunae]|uniref:Glycerol-3-phosphate acyltransferase n=1 Tax=Neolewinella lacunae TaxID=1517758 RepID=A0A923T7W2_9BACT|nr:1-acyl-sn-glycerol-3-phosphate acyltransferase [Neolewinella lacunae]MBC6993969.1 1-acyl-sn-glycerol-3-phosphate acyltransferase [Neolewinella lacunae]MDN3635516.1 1-acyl-sn-glycerol-3-phosphate acyltransferase [Neolewinella lacunae]
MTDTPTPSAAASPSATFQHEGKRYPHTAPEIHSWAINQLHEDRADFVRELEAATTERILEEHGRDLNGLLSKTLFAEQQRTKDEPWKVDPPQERRYWKRLAKMLATRSLDENEPTTAENATRTILGRVVHRYADEIVGHFKIPTFKFARRFLTFFFGRLLNAADGRSFRSLFSKKILLQEKLLVRGYVDQVRELSQRGTVVMVPTHFSNLDSILIGYAMDQVAGLPAMSFGAGLNLYNTGYTAYFMNRLGAYRVDRRKQNPIYMTALKTFSRLIIQRGVPSLFFPGGTRSRSGALETKLKLGLLGTAVEAQRGRYQDGRNDKVFIVPVILSYPFVLEGQFLIEQHLRKEGQDRYIKAQDSFHSLRSILKFVWGVFSKGNRITITLGQPLDVLGNRVEADGKSYSKNGHQVSTREYFRDQFGKINKDYQRENEYTRMLGEKIVERYHADGIVLASHLVSYAAFGMLEKAFPGHDLYALLRLPPEDFYFDQEALYDVVAQLRDLLVAMSLEDRTKIAPEIYESPAAIVGHGIDSMGTFHIDKPLYRDRKGRIVCDNFALLYYYHNRLSTFKLNRRLKYPALLLIDERTAAEQ